jgi:hypothetical protein
MGVTEWEQREALFGDREGEWRVPARAPRQINGFVHYLFSSLLETQRGASGLCCFGLSGRMADFEIAS